MYYYALRMDQNFPKYPGTTRMKEGVYVDGCTSLGDARIMKISGQSGCQ
jgi:hypothetical protein